MQVFGIGKSDIGKVRANNEDTIYVSNERLGMLPNLFVVADGMGGHNAGEVASLGAVTAFCNHLAENHASAECDSECIRQILTQSLVSANEHVHGDAQNTPDHAGMGTTLSACSIIDNMLIFTHVGDSRIYIAGNDEITQLSRDHTLVADMVEDGSLTRQEARCHPNKNILTRAVGTDTGVNIDDGRVSLEGAKYVLLCSDGLTDMLDDSDIYQILHTDSSMEAKIEMMIAKALEAGGDDNISVILIGWGCE